jgi:hypothetical protein
VDVLEHEPDLLTRQRTKGSLAFEAAWRALPRNGIVPDRRDLSLHKFKKFMPDMALIDILPGMPARSRICVVGECIRERLPFPPVGQDYFQFLPVQLRAIAAQRLKAIVSQPCGIWQVLGIHYQRDVFKSIELTGFPLFRENGPPQIMGVILYSQGQVSDIPGDVAMISLDRATATAFLDIGAGVPVWPPVDNQTALPAAKNGFRAMP